MKLIAFDFIDISVVDKEINGAVFLFPDLLHFSSESIPLANRLEIKLAIRLFLNPSQIVVTTGPDVIVLVEIDHRDTGDTRCMDHAPLHIIII